MREIKAVIRPNKLPALREALREVAGFPGMTVCKVEGLSSLARLIPGKTSLKSELTDYTAKVRIEIVAPDELADRIVDVIVAGAGTGQVGDGLVWVTAVERSVFVHKTMPGAEAVKDYPK